MTQATKKSLSGKKNAAAATPRPSSAGKGIGICYDLQAGKCTKGKRKANLDPVQELQVDQCLLDLGINCVSSGRQVCHRGSECACQHPLKPAAPSAKDDKRGKSKNKRKKKKKGDRSSSSSRGSNTYMKQAKKDGLTLLQRVGTDAHSAYNCSVQDIKSHPSACTRFLFWETSSSQVSSPQRRGSRQVAPGSFEFESAWLHGTRTRPTRRSWWTNRCWFGTRIASTAPASSLRCMPNSICGSSFLAFQQQRNNFSRRLLGRAWSIRTSWATWHRRSTQGGSRALPAARQPDPNVSRSSRPGYGSHQGSYRGYSQQEWNDYYNQWSETKGISTATSVVGTTAA